MATKKSASARAKAPSHEEISALAQKMYEDRMKKGLSGTAESDWLAAEQELGAGSK